MKTITIEDIDKKSYDGLQRFVNENDWMIWVVLDSNGWEVAYARLMLLQIELVKERCKLICANHICSSAFYIFYKYTWAKIMCDWCWWLRHHKFVDVSINALWEPTYATNKCEISSIKQCIDKPFDFMTKKEVKLYNKWKDVTFDWDRMKEIFPLATII